MSKTEHTLLMFELECYPHSKDKTSKIICKIFQHCSQIRRKIALAARGNQLKKGLINNISCLAEWFLECLRDFYFSLFFMLYINVNDIEKHMLVSFITAITSSFWRIKCRMTAKSVECYLCSLHLSVMAFGDDILKSIFSSYSFYNMKNIF